nr:hypothetical protein [Akkermansiaceae bacterium]
MKPSLRNPLLRPLALAAITLILGQSAHSAALTWAGGAGIWETGVQGGWDATWNNNDTGTFNGTGGIVTVQSAITTGTAELAFTAGDYSLSAGSPFGITLGSNNVRVTPSLTATVGQNVTLSRAGGLS